MFLQYEMGDRSRQHSRAVLRTRQTDALPFALGTMGDFICDARYYTRRCGLEECLLLYTLKGAGRVEYEKQRHVLRAGQLFLLDCRKYHAYATEEAEWHFLWIHFFGKSAFDYESLLNEGQAKPVALGKRISLPDYYQQLAYYADQFDLIQELEISILLQRLLSDLIQLKRREGFSIKYGGYRERMEESIHWMKEHFREEICVDQLAERCHLSKFYYTKMFQSYSGQTPYGYLMGVRLKQAQQLLLETERSVGEIALACGFSESKNFIACFKKKVGITPLQFRKKNQAGNCPQQVRQSDHAGK